MSYIILCCKYKHVNFSHMIIVHRCTIVDIEHMKHFTHMQHLNYYINVYLITVMEHALLWPCEISFNYFQWNETMKSDQVCYNEKNWKYLNWWVIFLCIQSLAHSKIWSIISCDLVTLLIILQYKRKILHIGNSYFPTIF